MKEKLQKFNVGKFIIKNKISLCLLVIGLTLGALIMSLFIPSRIAKLKNGEEAIVTFKDFQITADDYYTDLKNLVSLQLLIEKIDENILDRKYETTEDMKVEIEKNMADTIKEYITYYKYTEKDFLTNNGFKSKDEFYQILKLEYKRDLYIKDYALTLVKNDEVNNYYIKSVNPDMEIKYITGTESVLNLILKDLDNGKSYDDVVKSYKKNINYKDLSYVAFDNEEVHEDIYDMALTLGKNGYTKTPLKIDDTYYLVFKGNVKNKDKVDDIRDRIKGKIRDQKLSNDTENKIYYDALIKLRNDAGITFNDTVLKTMYDDYMKEVRKASSTSK